MSLEKHLKTKPAKRIRPAVLTIKELENYISAHEGLTIVFRTDEPLAVIRNVGLYTGSYPLRKSALKRLPLAQTDVELHERIRLYTGLGYFVKPRQSVAVHHDTRLERIILQLRVPGTCFEYERYPD